MTYKGLADFTSPFQGDSGLGGTNGLVPAPAAGDAAANKFLKADGTWVIPSGGGGGGVNSIGVIDTQSPSSDGAVISGSILYMQSASLSTPGLVNTGSQQFSGPKTFDSSVYFSYLSSGGITYAESTGRLNNDPTNLNWDSINYRLGLGTSTPAYDIHLEKSSGISDVFIFAKNTAITGSQDAAVWTVVSNAGTGNAYFNANDGTQFWSFGLKKSFNNSFIIAPSSSLSGLVPYLTIQPTGEIGTGGVITPQAAFHIDVSAKAVGLLLNDLNNKLDGNQNQVGLLSKIIFQKDLPSNIRGISLENGYVITLPSNITTISNININPTYGGSGNVSDIYGIYIDTGFNDSYLGTATTYTNLFVESPALGTYRKVASFNGIVTVGNDYSVLFPNSSNSLYVQNSLYVNATTGLGQFNVGNGTSSFFEVSQTGSTGVGGTFNIDNCLTIRLNTLTFNAKAVSITGTTISGNLTQKAIDIDAILFESLTNAYGINNTIGFSVNTTSTLSLAAAYNASPKFTGNTGTIVSCYGYRYDGGGSLSAGSVLYNYGAYFTTPAVGSFARIALYSDNLCIGFSTTNPPTNGALISGQLQVGSNTTNNNIRAIFTSSSTDYCNVSLVGTTTAVNSLSNFGLDISSILSPTFGSTLSTGIIVRPNFNSPSGQTISKASGIYIQNGLSSNVGTITNFTQLYIDATSTSAGIITNSYGLFVAAASVGTNKITAAFGGGISVGATNLTVVPPTNGAIFQGNIGINATAAIAPLTIGNANILSGEIIRINATGSPSYIGFYNNTTQQATIGTGTSGSGLYVSCANSMNFIAGSAPINFTTSGMWVNGAGSIACGYVVGDITQTSGMGYFRNGVLIGGTTTFSSPILFAVNGETTSSATIKITSSNSLGPRIIIENTITGARTWALISNGPGDTGGNGNFQISDQSSGATGNLFINNANGYTGLNDLGISIGTSYYNISPPSNGLLVQGRSNFGVTVSSATSRMTLSPSTGDTSGLTINGTVDTLSGSRAYGLVVTPSLVPTLDSDVIAGISLTPSVVAATTKTIINFFGLQIAPTYSSNVGSITTATNLFIGAGTAGTGTIGTAYGLWVKKPTAATTNICAYFEGEVKFGTGTTGTGSASFGANCPAITTSAPYIWVPVITNDGSTGYVAIFK